MPNELVSLYRCKICGARMFIERTGGHLESHGLPSDLVADYFESGPKDTFRRPGGNLNGLGHSKPGRGRRPVFGEDDGFD